MHVSKKGLDLIKHFEGCRLKAYRDSVGVHTIGYGHTNAAGPPKVRPGMEITKKDAERILKTDLVKYEDEVKRLVRVKVNQAQFDALTSFCFNLGPTNLARSTLLKKLNARDYDGAAQEFTKWVNAGGKRLRGLVRRRKAERDLFRSGSVPAKKPKPKKKPVKTLSCSKKYNAAVKPLQKNLGITVDGLYGPKTEAAVKKYQRKHKLLVDGIAGPQTLKHIGLA